MSQVSRRKRPSLVSLLYDDEYKRYVPDCFGAGKRKQVLKTELKQSKDNHTQVTRQVVALTDRIHALKTQIGQSKNKDSRLTEQVTALTSKNQDLKTELSKSEGGAFGSQGASRSYDRFCSIY